MSIKIDKERDILIVEKFDKGMILKGSDIFCGCCGNSIGEVKKNLKFPFMPDVFLSNLKNKSVKRMTLGLKHSTCDHLMFSFSRSFDFISLENYKKQVQ